MSAEREAQFKDLVREFPDSPMGHFSLGRYYLDEKRFEQSVASLSEAVRLDATYAAAMVALGDAYVGSGRPDEAKVAWQRALATPHGQRDGSLQADLEQRISALDDF